MYEKIYMRGQSNVVYKISLNFELQQIIKKLIRKKEFLKGIVGSFSEYCRYNSNLEREVKKINFI